MKHVILALLRVLFYWFKERVLRIKPKSVPSHNTATKPSVK